MRSRVPIGAGYSPEQVERGVSAISRCEAWEYANRDACEHIESLFLKRVEAGKVVSGAWLVQRARKRSFVDREGNDTRINNDFAPIIARKLKRKYPQYAHLVETRRSVFDWLC